MPVWLFNRLDGVGIDVACLIWNAAMRAVTGVITATPQGFSAGTWSFVEGTLYPWALSIGVSMLNLCFIISIWQAVKNFHQNITLEMVVEALIKIVAANVVFLNIMRLIKLFFSMASLMAADLFTMQAPELKVEDTDLTAALFYWLFGCLFILVAAVCSFMILTTVYGRYVKLYTLVVVAPFAVPMLVGGQGMEGSFYGWLKTFLANVFEVVVIALSMVLCWKLIGAGSDLFLSDSALMDHFDGGLQVLNSMFTMVLLTVTVKGSNQLLARAFRL